MARFLFRMENVGERAWKNKTKIVNTYFKVESNPFVRKSSSGYSVSDFQMMQDALRRRGYQI